MFRLLLWLLIAIGGSPLLIARTPNVVVILADDQGWGDLSLHGNPNLRTPNIDSLARDGAQVEHFYVCAVCSPTRAEFLTGRYHGRMGVDGTSVGRERFAADEQTIAQLFRDQGYATAAYGKWHSGMQWPYHPNSRGFDDFYGFCSGHWDSYFSPMLEHNGKIVQGDGFIIDDLTNHAIDFASRNHERPFFLYLPLNTPHSPMQVPDPFWNRFKDKDLVPDPVDQNAKQQDLTHTRAALAMCENIDANVGRLLEHLDQSKLSDDTIVLYFSDNGPNGYRFNGGMRGRKGMTYEGGLRSPCLIRYPAKITGGLKVTEVAAAIDLLPTLVELAGLELDSPKPLDGKSIVPLLTQTAVDWPERVILSTWGRKASARSDRWRLHKNGELYDIQNDPGESHNVADQHPSVQKRIGAALGGYLAQIETPAAERPFTLGHPTAVYTQVPARDAVPTGGITRNNRHPNCTYMTNWKSMNDQITWDVDVLADGTFDVEMYYASASVGSVVQLSLGETSITATIASANEAGETGREHDRFKRQEGYTKAWQSMTVGQIQLAKGRGILRLKANRVAGDQVADFRLLMFRRID